MPLRFRADGSFTIVQFTDVHWHNGEEDNLSTRALMEAVLEAESPDLVALTGDIVGGYDSRDPARAYLEAVAPIEARGVPWAAVFGNHDDEGQHSRAELLRAQLAAPHCLTRRGPAAISGIGNYALRVASAQSDRLAAALYFLDSGSYSPNGIGHYAWIARDQIDWYARVARELAAEYAQAAPLRPAAADGECAALPALAFFHIPLPEYDEVWRSATCRGNRLEPVNAPALNSGLFAAMVEAGDVMGTFAGHDHLNDFDGELHGIRLCYGRATGHAGYGRADFLRGARIVRLHEGTRAFDTWLRLEDGSVVTEPRVHEPDA